jgi:hypothetical protein
VLDQNWRNPVRIPTVILPGCRLNQVFVQENSVKKISLSLVMAGALFLVFSAGALAQRNYPPASTPSYAPYGSSPSYPAAAPPATASPYPTVVPAPAYPGYYGTAGSGGGIPTGDTISPSLGANVNGPEALGNNYRPNTAPYGYPAQR